MACSVGKKGEYFHKVFEKRLGRCLIRCHTKDLRIYSNAFFQQSTAPSLSKQPLKGWNWESQKNSFEVLFWENIIFRLSVVFVWRGEKWENSLFVLVTERKLHNFFIHSKLCFYQHNFYSNTKKVFFKYLNYVLKHSVFVFIFSRETFLSIFSSRLSFFLSVFKALKRFLGWKKKCSSRFSAKDKKQSVGERTWEKNGQMWLVIFSRKWCRRCFTWKLFILLSIFRF